MRSLRAARCGRWLLVSILALAAGTSAPIRAQSATTLVAAGSAWKYRDDGSDQGTAWRSAGFNDASWPSGPAQLGYGDGDEATVVSFGPNASAKYITTYFRRSFPVTNPASFASLNLRILRDDGAVVYLNGVEVFRTNMPAGAIGAGTLAATAIGGTDESTFISTVLSPSALVAGTNVIAVEVHQSDPTSTDISFDLELVGNSSVSLTRGPYLQLGTPNSMVVRWRTSAAVVGRVQFGPSPGVVSGSAQETAATTEHEVRLTGLVPETVYYYSIGTPTGTLAGDASMHFKTGPVVGTERPVRVWAIGDSGTADANARAVRDAYAAFTGTRGTDVWLMLGDNAYNDGLDSEYQAAVFDTYPAMLRSTVLWPAYGNHDGSASDSATNTGPYYQSFTLPRQGEAGGVASGTEAYYSFDYANIHFVELESFETDRSSNGPMLTWLRRDLAANTQPWVIAYWHHPPYSKGSHDSDTETELIEMRQNAVPILENFGVDLVLSGHSHAYERSFLIDGHYGDSTTFTAAMKKNGGSGRADGSGAYQKPLYAMSPHAGAVYTVAGTSAKLGTGPLNHPAMYTSQEILGSLVIDIQGNRLDAAFVDTAGATQDHFTIVKGAGGPPPPPPSGATPYGGSPRAVPGTIQAEEFDEGGEGIAYHDSTTGNKGGVFRSTDVDIEGTSDAGGGYDIGWTRPGEWLQYTTNVAANGQYDVSFRLASSGSGGLLHLEVDGTNVSGAVQVPNTGGWQSWQSVSVPQVPLTVGTHRLRLVFDANGSTGGVANVNKLDIAASNTTTAYGGTPVTLPGTIEAENFDEGGSTVGYFDTTAGNKGGVYRQTDVDIEATTDAGGGWDVGWTRAGEWLQYTVNASAAGTYALELRLASASSGATVRVDVDGLDVTGPIAVPNTGGWQAWTTTTPIGIALSAGQHKLRLVFVTAGTNGIANVNFLKLTR
jgi:hypothetical protein